MQRKITPFFDSTSESESRLSEAPAASHPRSRRTSRESRQYADYTVAGTPGSLMNVVCTSSECYPSSTATSEEAQVDNDYISDSSDSMESENECTSSSEERPPEPKRAVTTVLGKSYQRRSKTRLDLSSKHPWLILDASGKGGYCKFCQKYYSGRKGLPKGSDGVFINKPFSKWTKATGSTKKIIDF